METRDISKTVETEMDLGFVITLVALSVLNLILHSIGTFLLIKIYRNYKETIEMLHLINLSVTELLGSIIILLDEGAELIYSTIDIPPNVIILLKEVDSYLYIVIYVIFCVYYMGMIYIIFDKLMVVLLNLRYPVYWNGTKSRYLLSITWLAAVMICVTICIACKFGSFNYQVFFTEYLSPIFNFSFVIFAVCTYVYLFHKYRQTRMVPFHDRRRMRKEDRQNMWQDFRNSRFYISVLLIISFLIFIVIPDLIYLFHGWAGKERSHAAKDAIKVSFQLSFVSDAVIHILMQPDVRMFCLRTIRVWGYQMSFPSTSSSQRKRQHPAITRKGISLMKETCI